MIYNLRRKFVMISAVSVSIVFAIIFGIIYIVSTSQLNERMDMLTEVISGNDGRFPDFKEMQDSTFPPGAGREGFFTPDTQFATRFFIVWTDDEGKILKSDMERISSVAQKEAEAFALQALDSRSERGWLDDYRYRVCETENGKLIVFVNGEMDRNTTLRLLYLVCTVMVGSFVIILLLIILISKRAVKPAAESYEKQRQFVTDANHELKTPLTLILSNVDIVEGEIGQNEWLDDIRSEGDRMGALINQLVALSRMDEDTSNLDIVQFDLSEAVSDTVSEFEGLAAERGKSLTFSVKPELSYVGDESLIRKLVAILMDNAIKYCDPGGDIDVMLYQKNRHMVITVENTYKNVDNIELGRLFDRFYRADRSRTYTGSFGVGLSIAKGIAKKHKGDISVYKRESTHIGFRVLLK